MHPSNTSLQDSTLLEFPALQKISGLRRPTAICRWLRSQGIAYIRSPNGCPMTTLEALNRRLAGRKESKDGDRERGIDIDAARKLRR